MAKKIYTTYNYDIFKHLVDNREVKTRTTAKIVNSIKKYGYITNPLIVNEKMEIIDGQNRLEALKELNMPVDYIVEPGTTVEHCRAMNMNQSNWTTMNWIDSYANGGNINYRYLKNLIDAYPKMKLSVIVFAISNKIGKGKVLMEGDFYCTAEEYNAAITKLEFIQPLLPIIRSVDGSSNLLECAAIFAYADPEVNNARLEKCIRTKIQMVRPIATLEFAFEELERIYNYGCRTRVYIKTNYLKCEPSRLTEMQKKREAGRKKQRSLK